jgi:succinate dehydrogenase/fumarate reductase flavoprotein subunit
MARRPKAITGCVYCQAVPKASDDWPVAVRDPAGWAQRLDQQPYEAYTVTTGITFAFGGLAIAKNAEVEDTSGHPIPGLYAAGEIVGGRCL